MCIFYELMTFSIRCINVGRQFYIDNGHASDFISLISIQLANETIEDLKKIDGYCVL